MYYTERKRGGDTVHGGFGVSRSSSLSSFSWSASQTEKSTQNKGSRTRISGFKKRESRRQEAFSLNVRLMVRLASYFSTPAMMILDPGGRFSQKTPGKLHLYKGIANSKGAERHRY